MVATLTLEQGWRRAMKAGDDVFEKAKRASAALDAAGVPYAIIGGNAVAAWVATVDEGAIRYTKDVDILLRREDLSSADAAMAEAGFVREDVVGIPIYLDGPDGMPSKGIHIIIAGEKVKDTDAVPAPDVAESIRGKEFQIASLEALVRMKLVAYRRKDQTHLTDLVQLNLIDSTWPAKYPPPLDARLQHIIDTPDG
jgi:hypothetical protein